MGAARVLAGQVVVFVGRLMTLGRRQAAELAARCGGTCDPEPGERTTLVVLGADTTGAADGQAPVADADTARRLRRVEELRARDPGRVRVISEDEFCALAGQATPTMLRQQYYGLRTIRSLYPGVRDDHLRYLEKWGLLGSVVRTPGEVYYGFGDVAVIKQLNHELAQGAPFRAVVRSLAAARAGQLALDFQPGPGGAPGAKVVSLAARPARAVAAAPAGLVPLTAAEQKFVEAERLETSEAADVELTMIVYRDALRLDPALVPAMVNLGNLHYALDQLAEAQALYVHAALAEPRCFEAHFNLGNVFHDLGRLEEAGACYAAALRLDASNADAHFYLAVTLEKLGRSAEARPHWRRYREIAPDGEWVDLAREFE
jgi:cytochrome c-type biogenesis protein CcmH/NrfG